MKSVPGVILAALIMFVSLPLAGWAGGHLLALQGIDPAGAASPISGALVAIVLGILIRNFAPLPSAVNPGIRFTLRGILRLGIVFIGIKLSLLDVVRLGAWGVPIVIVAIAVGLTLVTWISGRLNLPRRLGTLIAAGTSICGVTAILSVAPAIKAKEEEVAYAVANVTLFGLLGMFTYPYLVPLLFNASEQIGIFLGVAVHDTAQVVGAALTFREVYGDDVAFQVATVTKLTRNLFLAVVVPLLSWHYLRGEQHAVENRGESAKPKMKVSQALPTFVLGFVAMAILRTIGDATGAGGAAFGLLGPEAWTGLVTQIGDVWGSKYLLGTAMAAVGLNTHFSVFKGVGFKPFLVGFAGALLVAVTGFVFVWTLGSLIQL